MSRYEQKEGKKYTAVLMIVIVIILIVLAIWLYQRNLVKDEIEIKPIDLPKEKTETVVENEIKSIDSIDEQLLGSEYEIEVESGEELEIKPELPALENSDDSFKSAVTDVSGNLVEWFKAKDIIKKYLQIINDLSQNQVIYKHRVFIQVPGKIVVKEDSQGLYLAHESYRRYDRLANAIVSIDVQNGLDLYRRFKPLFNKVYKDFAYPAGYQLEDIFMKAAASVIESPIRKGRIALVQHSVKYKFADKKLEALNDVEKLMLRMGPENTKKIQAKLRQLVEAISVLNE